MLIPIDGLPVDTSSLNNLSFEELEKLMLENPDSDDDD